MKKFKIIVTGIVSEKGLEKLRQKYEVTYSKEPFSRQYILENIKDYDGLLLMGMKADEELIDAGKNLKVISVNGVGYDHVDLVYAKMKGVTVCNSPQSVRVPTSEMTFALILAAAKRLSFYDDIVRQGNWIDVSKEEFQGLTLNKSKLGIFGMGRIGSTVAKYGAAFGMEVLYNDPYKLKPEIEAELGIRYVEFDDLVKESDVLTIHAPLLESTRGLFSSETFTKMKKRAYIVNAARGPIINEEALVHALKTNEIAGAALDVFEFEPKVSKELRSLENVIMAPHAGTGTIEARQEIAEEASQNLIAFFENQPINVVNT